MQFRTQDGALCDVITLHYARQHKWSSTHVSINGVACYQLERTLMECRGSRYRRAVAPHQGPLEITKCRWDSAVPARPAHLENVRHTIKLSYFENRSSAVTSQKSAYASSQTSKQSSCKICSQAEFGSTVPVGLFGDGRKQIDALYFLMAAQTASMSTLKSGRRGTSITSTPARVPRNLYLKGMRCDARRGDARRGEARRGEARRCQHVGHGCCQHTLDSS